MRHSVIVVNKELMLQFQRMVHYTWRKSLRSFLAIAGVIVLFCSFVLLIGWADALVSGVISEIFHRQPKPGWTGYFRRAGFVFLVLGTLLLFIEPMINGFLRFLGQGNILLEKIDRWSKEKTKNLLQDSESKRREWPLRFNVWDALILVFFLFVAFVYQIAVMSPGYPTVILGGDAANIASFAAARAFPELFKNDAILGDLHNLGLYVTVHLPLSIWLEKLLGNFGLAYSLLLFPHVFLQYFSYYLFGRILFHQRYWAFLFSLAVSSPLILDGGERWGLLPDAVPRFTFQVLMPFLLILLLSAWRETPNRWLWVMIIAGLMAFIHPVSTPIWGFALWLGFWTMLPKDLNTQRKILEMVKLGGILVLALLPYVSIYLTYHQSGSGVSNYDLVYYILTEHFPANILNIPAAVGTLLRNTAQFGLLWYGVGGLLVTILLFPSERPRLKQLLIWMIGIMFVSILIPWVETHVERALHLVPLQTELMRGMRYLVPFLFIFWFYPFAELTRRSMNTGLTQAVFAVGTLLTLVWLIVNPPDPFTRFSSVLACSHSGQWICPSNTDQAAALAYIRESTPENARFTVFLTNRWSGIEVRYLGLRPMVYAYKDRGQLLYTNIASLRQWDNYQRREAEIFSSKKSPTLDDKRIRIVTFARETGADYILTDFSFPPEVQHQLNVIAVYQNSAYAVLKTYANAP